MSFWCRIKQSHLRTFSNQFKRFYVQIHGPKLLNYTVSNTRTSVLDNPGGLYRTQFDVLKNDVRFYAAPYKGKFKKNENEGEEEKEPTGPRLNDKITADVVRLVTEKGNDILPFNEAFRRAREFDLDLVEVDRTSKPPVCKIMDYNREQYKKHLAMKERAKIKAQGGLKTAASVKEVRFKTKVDENDLRCKVDTAIKLLEKGHRVRFHVLGKADEDIAEILSRVCALIEDICIVESGPAVERLVAYVVVRHSKFGPTKRGTKPQKIVVPPRVYEPKPEKVEKMDKQERRAARALEKSTRVDYEDDEAPEFVNEAFRVSSLPLIEDEALKIEPPPSASRENRYKKNPQINQLNNDDASLGTNRYNTNAPPPRGPNFQGNPTSTPNRYADNRPGGHRADNSTPPNRYAPNIRPGGLNSDNSTPPPNRYAPNIRPGGLNSDNSTAPPNRYAPTGRPGGPYSDNPSAPPNRYAPPMSRPGAAHSDNSTAPPNRYAPAGRPGAAPLDNSTNPPNRYAERRHNVRR